MKKFWNILSSVIVILIALAAAVLLIARLTGYRAYTVLSGSMEPTYSTGDLLFVKKVLPGDIEAGDPITYMMNEKTVVTHRVVEVLPDENDPTVFRYVTKGDANATADGGTVHINNVLGVPKLSIPLIGYAVFFVQRPPGMYIAIAAAAVFVIFAFLPDIKGSKKEKNASDEDDKNSEGR